MSATETSLVRRRVRPTGGKKLTKRICSHFWPFLSSARRCLCYFESSFFLTFPFSASTYRTVESQVHPATKRTFTKLLKPTKQANNNTSPPPIPEKKGQGQKMTFQRSATLPPKSKKVEVTAKRGSSLTKDPVKNRGQGHEEGEVKSATLGRGGSGTLTRMFAAGSPKLKYDLNFAL